MEYIWALLQGIFYFLTGVWPIFSMKTFEKVTGPKVDKWLVKTVGVLIAVVGIALIIAFIRKDISFEMVITAAGCALGLMLIDIIYSLTGVISKIYLLDAAAELVIIVGWVIFYFI
ncbi:MAG: hypothetical protein ACM3P0_03230 [Acidobacteriota bacterium]